MKKNKSYKHTAVFTPTMKTADLIEANYNLLDILSRLGIGLGFGEETLAEACRKAGVDVNALLLICNVYTFDEYVPSNELLRNADVEDITKYLHNSHKFYVDEGMSSLEKALGLLVESCSSVHEQVIDRFFSDYKKEVENHFAYEEQTVFPYVESITKGIDRQGYSIEQFEENHSNIDEKLNDLKNIVMKYLPESCDNVLRNKTLYHIFFLEKDLGRHTMVENNVLIPMVNLLEKNEKRQ